MHNATDATTFDQATRIAELETEQAEARREIRELHNFMEAVGATLVEYVHPRALDEYGDPA
jgi:hypothetical protein